MTIASITFVLFAAFSALRIFSYLPQIYRVVRDANGASAISYVTWTLWTGANLATALYAAANLGDLYLAGVSLVYAACCATVIGLTIAKRRAAPPVGG
jgi:energy-converting hydrogenase Eha subunit G